MPRTCPTKGRAHQCCSARRGRPARGWTAGCVSAATAAMHVHATSCLASTSGARNGVVHAPAGAGDERTALQDILGMRDRGYALAEARAVLSELLPNLPAHDRQPLHLRFNDDLTHTHIGARLGCSQIQVSRLIRQALGQRTELAPALARRVHAARSLVCVSLTPRLIFTLVVTALVLALAWRHARRPRHPWCCCCMAGAGAAATRGPWSPTNRTSRRTAIAGTLAGVPCERTPAPARIHATSASLPTSRRPTD